MLHNLGLIKYLADFFIFSSLEMYEKFVFLQFFATTILKLQRQLQLIAWSRLSQGR